MEDRDMVSPRNEMVSVFTFTLSNDIRSSRFEKQKATAIKRQEQVHYVVSDLWGNIKAQILSDTAIKTIFSGQREAKRR
ncbi:hypothetical protein AYI68_g1387 [Smittium mucronatum]|uniref:Uncharacterized protein n=1 Tax=Smittium mucronatum TaxID=133383 RepID=A0A1R0H5M3_9FUNG|nr:hypothetical protein AYI68_g1387 [Smittium mucronatum]